MRKRALFSLFFLGLVACSGPEGSGAKGSKDENPGDSTSQPKGSEGETSPETESGDGEEQELDCSKLESTGLDIGDVAPNLVLEDGEGKKVSLHDYCNDTVILIASEY